MAFQLRKCHKLWHFCRVYYSSRISTLAGVAVGRLKRSGAGAGLAGCKSAAQTILAQNFVEEAGDSILMAAFKMRERLQDKNVVLQMRGCNASPEEIGRAIASRYFEMAWFE